MIKEAIVKISKKETYYDYTNIAYNKKNYSLNNIPLFKRNYT